MVPQSPGKLLQNTDAQALRFTYLLTVTFSGLGSYSGHSAYSLPPVWKGTRTLNLSKDTHTSGRLGLAGNGRPVGLSKPHRLTCVLGHVVLELVDPLALVTTVRAQILPFLLVDPHMVLEEGRAKKDPENVHPWVLTGCGNRGSRQRICWQITVFCSSPIHTPVTNRVPQSGHFDSNLTRWAYPWVCPDYLSSATYYLCL